jgi:hypothetical protein
MNEQHCTSQYQLQNYTLTTWSASWRFCTTVNLHSFKSSNFVDAGWDAFNTPVSSDNNRKDFHGHASENTSVSSSVSSEKSCHAHSRFQFNKDPSQYISDFEEMEAQCN